MPKTQELEQVSSIGGLPQVIDATIESEPDTKLLEQIHILFYIHGNSRHIQNINFVYRRSFKEAIARGRQFCERMGWKFIKVEPFLTNLEDREKRNSGE
jgi:hypothetical protein